MKAADYGTQTNAAAAFVSTNSICQGQQVPILWPMIFKRATRLRLRTLHFKWANLASHNAGVIVVIVGISNHAGKVRRLFSIAEDGGGYRQRCRKHQRLFGARRECDCRGGFSHSGKQSAHGLGEQANRWWSSCAVPSLSGKNSKRKPLKQIDISDPTTGRQNIIRGLERFCIWVEDADADAASEIPELRRQMRRQRFSRASSKAAETRGQRQDFP